MLYCSKMVALYKDPKGERIFDKSTAAVANNNGAGSCNHTNWYCFDGCTTSFRGAQTQRAFEWLLLNVLLFCLLALLNFFYYLLQHTRCYRVECISLANPVCSITFQDNNYCDYVVTTQLLIIAILAKMPAIHLQFILASSLGEVAIVKTVQVCLLFVLFLHCTKCWTPLHFSFCFSIVQLVYMHMLDSGIFPVALFPTICPMMLLVWTR